jgi:hypothetical protein
MALRLGHLLSIARPSQITLSYNVPPISPRDETEAVPELLFIFPPWINGSSDHAALISCRATVLPS